MALALLSIPAVSRSATHNRMKRGRGDERGTDADSRAHHARGQRVPQGCHLGHLRALHYRLGRALIALGILEAVEACTRASEMVECLDGTYIHDNDWDAVEP